MNRKTRIAAIVLGAFVLGALAVVGWRAAVAEVIDLADRMRRARCAWADPLEVTVAGHAFSLAATPEVTVNTGDTWLSGEEVTGYRAETRVYGFCLDARPSARVPVRAVSLSFETARRLAERTDLPRLGGPVLEIAEADMFLPSAPPPQDGAAGLVIFDRDPELGWPRIVSEGLAPGGFRTGAVCRDGRGGDWICDVSALDVPAGLAYRFAGLPISAEDMAEEALSRTLVSIAEGMRGLVALMEDDALAQR